MILLIILKPVAATLLLFFILATFATIIIIAMEISAVCNGRVKSFEVYDLLKKNLVKKEPYCSYDKSMYLEDFRIDKQVSILHPYYISHLGAVRRWTKSARLIKSFQLTKRETRKLEYQNNLDVLYNKYKNKTN